MHLLLSLQLIRNFSTNDLKMGCMSATNVAAFCTSNWASRALLAAEAASMCFWPFTVSWLLRLGAFQVNKWGISWDSIYPNNPKYLTEVDGEIHKDQLFWVITVSSDDLTSISPGDVLQSTPPTSFGITRMLQRPPPPLWALVHGRQVLLSCLQALRTTSKTAVWA